ncbi:MAG: hypothetical protein NZZ41_00200 [Candidatus Dojkabacteria bacterium]|nr:hypothetical protein [Candidatus Dojkabacteria bacterium]
MKTLENNEEFFKFNDKEKNFEKISNIEETNDENKKYETNIWELFEIMRTKKDIYYLDTIDEEKKENILEILIVLQKWLSNPTNLENKKYIRNLILLNDMINKNIILSTRTSEEDFRDIVFSLMICLCPKNKTYKRWINFNKKEKELKILTLLKESKILSSKEELLLFLKTFLSKHEDYELFEFFGINDKNIQKMIIQEIEELRKNNSI